MESYLNENFGAAKLSRSPDEVLRKWRKLCETVKIPKRRFRFVSNRAKRNSECQVSSQAKPANFPISADESGSIAESRDEEKLRLLGGVAGVSEKLSTTLADGIAPADAASLAWRRRAFGANKFGGSRIFWGLVLEDLKGVTYIILGLYALLSLFLGIATQGWPQGAIHGIFTILGLLFYSVVAATVDYSCFLLDAGAGKGKLEIQVTRNGAKERVRRCDLLVGDIVHLSAGDEVPADGLFVWGSSTSGDGQCPFLLHGAKLEEGSCAMMVTAVGMRTVWAKTLAAKLRGGGEGDEEATLQLWLNRVATVIGKICLVSEVVAFAILASGIFRRKFREENQWSWSGDDAMEFLEIFALAITGKSKSGKHELKGFVRSQVCKYAFFPN